MKMSDLHIAMTVNTDAIKRKADIISKHLTAMSEELDLADQLEHDDGELLCSYCKRPVNGNAEVRWPNVYCSKGCAEMAGMEQAFPVRSGCGARWPSGTWGQSCLEHCTCIDKVIDKVILRLRDNFGMNIEG